MEEITFHVQGSAIEPYIVRFRKRDANLTAHCTCPAGAVGQYCKHRIGILEGQIDAIVSNNKSEVATVTKWLIGSDVEKALQDVRAAEERAEVAKTELTLLKKKLAKTLLS